MSEETADPLGDNTELWLLTQALAALQPGPGAEAKELRLKKKIRTLTNEKMGWESSWTDPKAAANRPYHEMYTNKLTEEERDKREQKWRFHAVMAGDLGLAPEKETPLLTEDQIKRSEHIAMRQDAAGLLSDYAFVRTAKGHGVVFEWSNKGDSKAEPIIGVLLMDGCFATVPIRECQEADVAGEFPRMCVVSAKLSGDNRFVVYGANADVLVVQRMGSSAWRVVQRIDACISPPVFRALCGLELLKDLGWTYVCKLDDNISFGKEKVTLSWGTLGGFRGIQCKAQAGPATFYLPVEFSPQNPGAFSTAPFGTFEYYESWKSLLTSKKETLIKRALPKGKKGWGVIPYNKRLGKKMGITRFAWIVPKWKEFGGLEGVRVNMEIVKKPKGWLEEFTKIGCVNSTRVKNATMMVFVGFPMD